MVSLSTQGLLALIWASAALATPLVAEAVPNHDLITRDGTVCPDAYTSKNGMNFTTYCKQNNPQNDVIINKEAWFESGSMSDCMEHCSRYWGDGEGCFGVVWREDNKCWLRNSTTSISGLKDSTDGTHSALIATDTYAKIDTACPDTDLSTHTLDGAPGLGYTTQCNKIITNWNTCWSGYPKPCWDDQHVAGLFRGFYHTKTLDECIRICVDQSPLCKGVSWNPDYSMGFANCWPKTGWSDNDLITPKVKWGVVHSVTITNLDRPDSKCPSSSTYSTTDNNNFDIHCGQLNEGTNLTSIHAQNITSCMDSCATTDKCVGVVFDSTLFNGFKNCYLQNTTSTISDKANVTFAALSGSSIPTSSSSSTPDNSNSGTPASSSASDSRSKAWVAGPVVGGLVGLAIIAGALFWWRRRQNAAAGEKHDGVQYDVAPAYVPGQSQQSGGYYDAHAAQNIGYGRVEVDGGTTRNELPETTKYAHRTGDGKVHEAP